MSTARHLEDLAEELSTRKAAGERTLKVWGHRRGLTLPDVRSLARQLVAQGRMIEGEGPGGLVWRPTERRTLDLPPLEIETGEPSSRSAPLVTPRNPTSFEGPKPEVLQEAEEEPIMPAGAAEPCQRCEYLRLQLNAPCQECERLRQERDVAQGEAHGLRQQLQEVSAERDEARARCAAWEQEADHAYRQLCRAADLGEGSPLSSILERVRLLVAGAQASAEPEEEPPPQAPAPSPRSLFGGLTPEARRTVADVLGELAAHLRQEPAPSGKIGRGLDRLSTNARTVLDILPRGEEPSITRKEIKARSGLDNTNSVSTALRTLERLGLASSPSWGFWRAA